MATDKALTSEEGTTQTYDRLPQTLEMGIVASPRLWTGRPKSVIESLLMCMCVLGFIANLAMLISLIMYKQAARKTVNTFVCNQTALDVVSAFFSGIKVAMLMSGYLVETKTGVLRT